VANPISAQTVPTLATLEQMLAEVEEWFERFEKVRRKLGQQERGSEAYLDMLPELEVHADVLRSKAEQAHEALEAFEDSLPDDV
jgi:hypothetical protein